MPIDARVSLRRALRRTVLFAVLLFWLAPLAQTPMPPVLAQTFGNVLTVTSTDDSDDGLCLDLPGVPEAECTLREAINAANANPDRSRILFDIPGGGVKTIELQGGLPRIEAPVEIDGYTQSGARANAAAVGFDGEVRVELANGGNVFTGLSIGADDVAVRGLAVFGFRGQGIVADGADGAVIAGNIVGARADGLSGQGNNGAGVELAESSGRVGGPDPADRNVIVGNDDEGVEVSQPSGRVLVENNLIGVAANGQTLLGNEGAGVRVVDGSGVTIRRNAICGNGKLGIDIGAGRNDRGDKDKGANGKQNVPVLTRLDGTTLRGALSSTPRRRFVVEVFASPGLPGLNVGGLEFLGERTVRTNRKGKASFTLALPAVPGGTQLTATATEERSGNTSQFSAALVAP